MVPSGKITMTFPRNVGQIPIYYAHRTTGRPNPGNEFQKFRSNYIDVPNSPLFPFGYDLSYTSFEYSEVTLSRELLSENEKPEAVVTVANTGNYDGEEVVQLYIQDMVASIIRPVKELKGFQKIRLKPGESQRVRFIITEDHLKFYNYMLEHVAEPGTFKAYIGPNSRDTNAALFTYK